MSAKTNINWRAIFNPGNERRRLLFILVMALMLSCMSLTATAQVMVTDISPDRPFGTDPGGIGPPILGSLCPVTPSIVYSIPVASRHRTDEK